MKPRDQHARRDARAAALASRPVGDRLAPAKSTVSEDIVEFRRALADQMRENFALFLARQIRTGRGRSKVELRRVARKLRVTGAPGTSPNCMVATIATDANLPELPRIEKTVIN